MKVNWKDTALRGIMVGYAEGRSRDTYKIYMFNSREIVETRDVWWADQTSTLVITKMPGIFNNIPDAEADDDIETGIIKEDWIEIT